MTGDDKKCLAAGMEGAIRSKDVPTLRRKSHSLKSGSMQIGAAFPGEMSAQAVFYLENYIEMYQS